jgi:hypothetical protein
LRHPATHGFARNVDAVPLEHLLLPVQRLMIRPFRHDHLRLKLAPAGFFSIGCGSFVAIFTVQSQAYFRQTS